MELIEVLDGFRRNYFDIRRILPWLDSCIWENDKPAFTGFAKPIDTKFIESLHLDLSLAAKLSNPRSKNAFILRYDPNRGSLDSFNTLFPGMIENKIPLAILHTDVGFDELIRFANKNRELNIIIESGPRKLLYYFDKIKETLRECKNVFLSTYNFCNWLDMNNYVRWGCVTGLFMGLTCLPLIVT